MEDVDQMQEILLVQVKPVVRLLVGVVEVQVEMMIGVINIKDLMADIMQKDLLHLVHTGHITNNLSGYRV
jgi:hypothetical protein